MQISIILQCTAHAIKVGKLFEKVYETLMFG